MAKDGVRPLFRPDNNGLGVLYNRFLSAPLGVEWQMGHTLDQSIRLGIVLQLLQHRKRVCGRLGIAGLGVI